MTVSTWTRRGARTWAFGRRVADVKGATTRDEAPDAGARPVDGRPARRPSAGHAAGAGDLRSAIATTSRAHGRSLQLTWREDRRVVP